tara:strand:- start:1031 stop:1159 length:129 start_codon:yes stop_codon:yes gene_type:complete
MMKSNEHKIFHLAFTATGGFGKDNLVRTAILNRIYETRENLL